MIGVTMPTALAPLPPTAPTKPLADDEIIKRINACPRLASLQSINRALGELVRSDGSLNSQIAEVIRRDPSLSARLLRMVNSVYFGLSTRVNNIEEAVFFLGLRQIRELSMATPVIEELEQLQHSTAVGLPWKELWSHSISTAILTREILASTTMEIDDDTDYLVGLLHNVGKVVMAYSFPLELRALMAEPAETPADFCRRERELIGWDHGRIGAHLDLGVGGDSGSLGQRSAQLGGVQRAVLDEHLPGLVDVDHQGRGGWRREQGLGLR
jgi:HD-like signal output (HDOD) protein